MLAFRIFVMLACLIVVPMAAIFGSAFPDVVKSVLVDRIVAWGTGKATETNASPTGFAAVTPAGTNNLPAAGTANWEAPRWGAQGGGVVPATGAGIAPSGGNQSASFSTPADPGHAAGGGYGQARLGTETPYQQVSAENPIGRQSFGHPAGVQVTPGHEAPGALATHQTPQPLEQPDRFTLMERKLREYGATYYLLETSGKEGELYRFHCKMAVGNNPNYTRQFEATDRDALRAIAQVLERVESWRAGRSQ